jgi:hypothetical protein
MTRDRIASLKGIDELLVRVYEPKYDDSFNDIADARARDELKLIIKDLDHESPDGADQ